ncbi:myosin-G heavy chain [Anastrepha obliqua]|uniref:myosin-G heavy chain n=1 Tax=Anastrepha obliqua TaxID=95512 RepID=UPI002409E396|nr:myosin-G heavy chain [Anastrepha obliqua]XP_054731249.1 myosin-G heavy chain [Anastrepha obliqua]XP_054731250.1 myosin-G heavy chain [Anastrepha obliqua]
MNRRNKRARLELSVTPTTIDAGIGSGCAVASNIGDTQSIFLGNTTNSITNGTESVSMLPANVFLTICDENSDESQDYLAIGSTLAQIKQEHEDALCIGNVSSSSSTQSTQTLPLQYRIVNQTQRQLPSIENITSSSVISNNTANTLSATLPMQLPNGCEIYIVKEYVDNIPTILTEDSELLQGPSSTMAGTTSAIKLEPDSCATSTAGVSASTSTPSINGVQILRNTSLPCMITTKLPNTATDGRISTNRNAVRVSAISAGDIQDNSTKRSCILEAYKKRDDKRRATHNEVERRRRDKINNWIFKLKEMLPIEGGNNNNNNHQQSSILEHLAPKINTNTSNGNNSTNNNNSNGSNRTPPSDSKSQILIKACEYIKTMQNEIKSLRECLSENENLRLSNQRLQNELSKLQSEKAATVSATLHTRNFNSNFNITLNSLNSNNSNGSGGVGGGASSASSSPGGTGSIFSSLNITPNVSSTNTFPKRELIIRDYVD